MNFDFFARPDKTCPTLRTRFEFPVYNRPVYNRMGHRQQFFLEVKLMQRRQFLGSLFVSNFSSHKGTKFTKKSQLPSIPLCPLCLCAKHNLYHLRHGVVVGRLLPNKSASKHCQ